MGRAGAPTEADLPRIALDAQPEVLGGERDTLGPEALAAADRVLSTLYRDTAAYQPIRALLPVLGPTNPREAKRYVNLFRFHTFIGRRRRLRGADAPSPEQVAKLAALVVRWPHLLTQLGVLTSDAERASTLTV